MNRIIKYRVVRPPEKEEWAIIEASDGSYYISNLGNVKRVHKGRTYKINPFPDSKGYLVVGILNAKKGKRNVFVHRLVAMYFVPNPRKVNIVNHLDENRGNNYYKNLKWVTNSENLRYKGATSNNGQHLKGKGRGRVPKTPVESIDPKTGVVVGKYDSIASAKKEGGASYGIHEVLNGKNKTHHGLYWRYVK